MKTITFLPTIAAVAAIALTAGCGQSPAVDSTANAGQLDTLTKERDSLKAKLANAQSRIDSLRAQLNSGGSAVVDSGMSAPDIIEELTQLKITSANRRAVQRRINFLLESLVEQGEASVPHIREYLNKMEDIDFVVQRAEEEERGRGGSRWNRNRGSRTTLDFDQPPSMRIGLIDILAEIGGDRAEAALAEVLAKTARGFEVAYTAKKIQGWLGKESYRDEALDAAHTLLSDPVEVPNPNNFDKASKQYLFMVLEMYNDQTFVQSAQGMLINDDGGIDRTVLDYLNDVGKEQAMDAIFQAFNGGQVTDRGDLANLARAGLKYAGTNPQANQMFKDIMSGDEYTTEVKWSALREMDDDDEPSVMRARLSMMQNFEYAEGDTTGKLVQLYSNQLEAKINGEKFDMQGEFRKVAGDLFQNRGRGERGGLRNRGRGDGDGDAGNRPTIVPAP